MRSIACWISWWIFFCFFCFLCSLWNCIIKYLDIVWVRVRFSGGEVMVLMLIVIGFDCRNGC